MNDLKGDSRKIYSGIVTHNDFDGLVSAALVSYALKIERIRFTGPNAVTQARIPISADEVVCDLPYPKECGMWFDHHAGNLQELALRKIDPATIPGSFAVQDSCARVVLEYYAGRMELPTYLKDTVDEADVIDAFRYENVEAWRRETPGRIVANALLSSWPSFREKDGFYRQIVLAMRDRPLKEAAAIPEVAARYREIAGLEEGALKLIRDDSCFLPEDAAREIMIIDLTRHNRRPFIIKNLAYLVNPQAQALLLISSVFDRGVKTNNLSFSMSLGFSLNNREHKKDVGEIMRTLNLGDGHPGAAAGNIDASAKAEMQKKKERICRDILKLWQGQK